MAVDCQLVPLDWDLPCGKAARWQVEPAVDPDGAHTITVCNDHLATACENTYDTSGDPVIVVMTVG